MNFCRNRAYEEFDMKAIQVKAAMGRARAFYKWKNSCGLISGLIITADEFKVRQDT
jgi:hypothetical protein